MNSLDSVLFDVEMQPLSWSDSGENTPIFGLRRKDTGEFLASCSDRYGITQNQELVSVMDECLKELGMVDYDVSAIATGGGRKCYINYSFTDKLVQVGKEVGDVVGLQVTLLNSFDKTLLRGIRVGLLRLICGNGMIAFENDLSIEDRHTINNTEINKDALLDALRYARDEFEPVVMGYRRMVDVQLTNITSEALFDKMVALNIVRPRIVMKVKEIWESPTFAEDSDRNLYNFLNAWTQFLDSPHSEYRLKHFETAQVIKKDVFKFLRKVDDSFIESL